MNHVVYPPDPDCPACGGTGTLATPTLQGSRDTGFAIGPCNCRRPENVAKVQARCDHEFVCRKCGAGK